MRLSRRGAGALAATGGALLVISLLLNWWGTPPVLVNPPADAPAEIEFMAEAQATNGRPIAADAFEFYDVRDVVWLATGIVAFLFGLAAMLELPAARVLAIASGLLGVASLLLVVAALVAPPDFIEINEAAGAGPLDIDFDVPFSREAGGWVALAATIGLTVSAGLFLGPRTRTRRAPSRAL